MELIFPLAIYVGVPATFILLLVGLFKRKEPFRDGKKVAHTDLIEELPLYRRLRRNYKCFSTLALGGLWGALLLAVIMMARPAKVDRINPEIHNRDIFICMDISSSVDRLNLDICKELKEVVKQLNGERFGVTIFNGQSVLLIPLTSDYQYVLDTLDTMEDAFRYSLTSDFGTFYLQKPDLYNFKYDGTMSEHGSSFIGDGLASCLYNFPDLTENQDRSRLIIFSTDNELNGEPIVTVEEAAALCKKHDVKVFALTPEDIVDKVTFQDAMNSTGGGFYEVSSSKVFDELLEDIKLTDTSVMKETKTIITDQPETLFIWLIICISIHFVFSRKVKL